MGNKHITDDKYFALLTAMQDLLCELRIDQKCLEMMAQGYSPDHLGMITDDEWKNPHCKIQLSKVIAQGLISAGVTGLL